MHLPLRGNPPPAPRQPPAASRHPLGSPRQLLPLDGRLLPFDGRWLPFDGNPQPFDGNPLPFDGNPPARRGSPLPSKGCTCRVAGGLAATRQRAAAGWEVVAAWRHLRPWVLRAERVFSGGRARGSRVHRYLYTALSPGLLAGIFTLLWARTLAVASRRARSRATRGVTRAAWLRVYAR